MKDLKTIRGMPDLYAEEMNRISFVEDVCTEIFRSFNFQEFRTPILENKSLFERSAGDTSDIVQKEVYEFEDRKGDLLCLRPEGTAGIVRALVTNGLDNDEIKKYFYIGPMFRYERPQKGRKRQFYQAGAELIGDPSSNADIEVIQVANLILEKLNVKAELQINYIGCADTLEKYREYLRNFLKDFKDTVDEKLYFRLQRNPIRALDSKDENIKKILKDVKKIKEFFNKEQKEKFQDIQKKLLDAGVDFKINENLVRGLDYYTGTVFEYISSELGAQNAILGGGRYDNLIENLGCKKLPATGFALGIDRLSEIINEPKQAGGIFIGSLDAESKSFAQKIAYQLRKNSSNLKIETYLGNANLSKQIKKADSQSFKFVMIVGQEEQKSLKFKLKDLELNKSFELSEKELLEYFSG